MAELPVTRDDVLAARETIGDRLYRTPTLSSRALGPRVYLKAELLQRTGSFKPRGILNRLAALSAEERARGVVTWSAGNAAQAVAWAAATEGIDSLVLMWRTANALKVAASRAYGAAVDTTSADPWEAYERLQAIVEETGRTFIHPFDDPLLTAGHGTLALEILEDVPKLEAVIVPVGGGGLISGITVALAGRARIVAVEPEGAAGFAAALTEGTPVRIVPRSIADGLAAPFAGTIPIAVCAGRVETVTVTEEEIAEAMRFVYARAKLACEPAGATAVAAILSGKVTTAGSSVAVISGGNADPKIAAAILAGDL
jgi:threonine dehydratase